MARRLVNLCGGNLTVALVDYRLTTQKPLSPSWSKAAKQPVQYDNRHPAHLEDVFAALRFLLLPAKDDDGGSGTKEDELKSPPSKKTKHADDDDDDNKKRGNPATRYSYNADKIIVMGHSVGAWMAAAMMLDSHTTRDDGSVAIPPLCDDEDDIKRLLSKVCVWVLVVSHAAERTPRDVQPRALLTPSSAPPTRTASTSSHRSSKSTQTIVALSPRPSLSRQWSTARKPSSSSRLRLRRGVLAPRAITTKSKVLTSC